MIKELSKEFEGVIDCKRENTEKYKSFSVPLKKGGNRIVRNGEEITNTISLAKPSSCKDGLDDQKIPNVLK